MVAIEINNNKKNSCFSELVRAGLPGGLKEKTQQNATIKFPGNVINLKFQIKQMYQFK